MSSRFTRPLFISYDGKTNPVGHVSHYIQMMSLHNHNGALMCRVFPSILEPIALRWFNELKKGLIHSFGELIQEFRVRFMTCCRVLQPVDSLLSIKMGARETLQSYASRYWELYNEIDGGNEKVTASTFLFGLLEDFELRELLTKRPPKDIRPPEDMRPSKDMRQPMRRIEKYKRLEDDWQQSKGKVPVVM